MVREFSCIVYHKDDLCHFCSVILSSEKIVGLIGFNSNVDEYMKACLEGKRDPS